MIEEPPPKLEGFVAAGADIVMVPAASTRRVHRVLQAPLQVIDPIFDRLELVLLLGVNPGWSGQKFILSTLDRVRQLKERVGNRVLISVDGRITRDNLAEVAQMGPDIIVTGSTIFDGKAPRRNLKHMLATLS